MENEESKETKLKVIYGKENLKDIVTDLMEKNFIDTIKKCENK